MFTGLIEEIGEITQFMISQDFAQLSIKAQKILTNLQIGDSISVNGICLTVNDFNRIEFKTDLMKATLKKTNLVSKKIGSKVNLERAMQLQSRIGGHLISGHIDCYGKITNIQELQNNKIIEIETPESLKRYIIPQGSIAVDGISLTIHQITYAGFTVSIIPHTIKETTLSFLKVGDLVNLEADLIGKYVQNFLENKENQDDTKSGLTREFLAEQGFI